MYIKKVISLVLLSAMLLPIIAAIPTASAVVTSTDDVEVSTRAATGNFVNPVAASTVSGVVAVDFYGTSSGAALKKATVAVYQGTTVIVNFATMTNLGSNHWGYNWNTASLTDGSGYELRVRAYYLKNKYTQFTCGSLVVSNGGTPPPPPPPPPGDNVLTSGQTVSSSLTSGSEMWTIAVPTNTASMYSVLTCGSADLDLYGRLGSAPTLTTYDWRGYTSGGEEVTMDLPGTGTWYIMVQVYSGSGAYSLTVTLSAATPPAPWGTGGKYAIIVGISDYASINDLSFCDEDATDFYNKLAPMGYECRVYGDGHTANYPRHDGKATEATVRAQIQGLAAIAKAGDTVCFITSGHGSGDGNGESYLCMYDCSGSVGCYYDHELAADIGLFAAGVNVFILIDHCYSGGMGPELMALGNKAYIFLTTTCTANGYGYDDPTANNGAWTYEFLEKTWIGFYGGAVHQTMESVYTKAASTYPHNAGDACMIFDGNTGAYFYLG
jgi:hypothetical protein